MTSDELLELRTKFAMYGKGCSDTAHKNRLNYELERIRSIGSAEHLLLLADILNSIRKRGGIVGPGRSSAPGCLVCYLLGITDIDPLQFGLLAERFLTGNPSKYLFLDIDVDSYGVEYVNNLRRIELEPGLSPYYVRFFQQDFLDRLREISGKEGFNYKDIPLDDKATYAMLAADDTEGLPIFGDNGMQEVLKEVRPSGFSQLVALYAICRPGPDEMLPEYISRSIGKAATEYPLDNLSDILGETYGLVLYQEQLMLIAQKVAGFTPEWSDRLRKAAGKHKTDILNMLLPQFLEGGIERGYEKGELSAFWNEYVSGMKGTMPFCKAHSVGCAYLGYVCAYLKVHFPEVYQKYWMEYNKKLTEHFCKL